MWRSGWKLPNLFLGLKETGEVGSQEMLEFVNVLFRHYASALLAMIYTMPLHHPSQRRPCPFPPMQKGKGISLFPRNAPFPNAIQICTLTQIPSPHPHSLPHPLLPPPSPFSPPPYYSPASSTHREPPR